VRALNCSLWFILLVFKLLYLHTTHTTVVVCKEGNLNTNKKILGVMKLFFTKSVVLKVHDTETWHKKHHAENSDDIKKLTEVLKRLNLLLS
jgi:hypothetical protein